MANKETSRQKPTAMLAPFDSTKVYNSDSLSDISVKFSGREVKCHRLVLCNISEYFNAVCGEGKKWKEIGNGTIELKDDNPDAVEAMLRHIYGFKYQDIEATLNTLNDIKFHADVVITAQKYLLPDLLAVAWQALLRAIRIAEDWCEITGDGARVFQTIQLLTESHVFLAAFGGLAEKLKINHLSALFKIKDFRTLLEAEEEKEVLLHLMKTVDLGQKVPRKLEENKALADLTFVKCTLCGMMWSFGEVFKCGNCGNEKKAMQIRMFPGVTK